MLHSRSLATSSQLFSSSLRFTDNTICSTPHETLQVPPLLLSSTPDPAGFCFIFGVASHPRDGLVLQGAWDETSREDYADGPRAREFIYWQVWKLLLRAIIARVIVMGLFLPSRTERRPDDAHCLTFRDDRYL